MHNKYFDLYDTTLRDGQQSIDVSFSVEGKLKIARAIYETLPVSHIEGGWPGANPTDTEFFKRAKTEPYAHLLAAFGMTRRANTDVQTDVVMQNLLAAETPFVTLVGKSDMLHVQKVFSIDPVENLHMIHDSVSFMRSNGRRVIYDAEHFFDGYNHDSKYALKTLQAAADAGAETIVLCDTNGGTPYWNIAKCTEEVINNVHLHRKRQKKENTNIKIGIHTHSDRGIGVANALAAIQKGALHAQGTILGIGERVGNADLLLLADWLDQMGYIKLANNQREAFTKLAQTVAHAAGVELHPNQALVGEHAFATAAGMHQSAMLRWKKAYAFRLPEDYGNMNKIVINNQSGGSAIAEVAQRIGLSLTKEEVKKVIEQIKEMEGKGYRYAKGRSSLELLMKRASSTYTQPFILTPNEDGALLTIIKGNKKQEVTLSPTSTHINTMFDVLKNSLECTYPNLAKIQIVTNHKYTEGDTCRVFLKVTDGSNIWHFVGVGKNDETALWDAVTHAVEFAISKLE